MDARTLKKKRVQDVTILLMVESRFENKNRERSVSLHRK